MNVKANKEYAVNIYLPNGDYWDYQHIKSCIISKARNIAEVITAAHKQLQRHVNGRYVFRNGKARKIA